MVPRQRSVARLGAVGFIAEAGGAGCAVPRPDFANVSDPQVGEE